MNNPVALAPGHKGAWLNYGFICIFLTQLFVLVACGSYINTAIVCVAWTIVLISGHEHNVIICVLCAISVVLQTYALSINSQRVLLVSSPRQRACETIGIVGIESLYQRNNIFRSCNADLFVPFIPHKTYALEHDSTIKLMYGGDARIADDNVMRMATCRTLGVACYRWNIQVQGFGQRRFEPCWHLVQHVHTTNASSVVMIHHTPSRPSEYNVNIDIPPPAPAVSPVVPRHPSRFIHFSSQVEIPLQLADTLTPHTKQLDSVTQAPDLDTIFVVVPMYQGQPTTMHLTMGMSCDDSEVDVPGDSLPFFHSGAIHLAAAATPGMYTIYAAFSECGLGGGTGCNSRLLTSFGVYVSNIVLCISCLLLTHGCAAYSSHQYSVVYIFAFATAVVTFNWVAIICIYSVHPASMHGGISNLNRPQQVACYLLHIVQLILLILELARNQLGNNTHFMLSRMHEKYSFGQLLLPFTLLDSNVYIENCALYFSTSCFIAYVLYYKCGVT